MKIDKEKYRKFLRAEYWSEDYEGLQSDQQKGIPYPDLQLPYPKDAKLIELPNPHDLELGHESLIEIINQRKSHRKFISESLSLEELTFLLWTTQGVKEVIRDGYCTKRTVPSAGARHPFELYILVNNVDSLKSGIYRYLPLDHKLLPMNLEVENLPEKAVEACHGQRFVGEAAVVFVWTVFPYRTEWRYTAIPSKIIALDAGHSCQNLYLAAEAIKAGTVAIGAYSQYKMDQLLGLDGKDHFTIYIAPVGKIKR